MSRVAFEEHLAEYAMEYDFVDGSVEPTKWLMNGFDLDLSARIEDKLVEMAYDDERERRERGSVYRDEATQ